MKLSHSQHNEIWVWHEINEGVIVSKDKIVQTWSMWSCSNKCIRSVIDQNSFDNGPRTNGDGCTLTYLIIFAVKSDFYSCVPARGFCFQSVRPISSISQDQLQGISSNSTQTFTWTQRGTHSILVVKGHSSFKLLCMWFIRNTHREFNYIWHFHMDSTMTWSEFGGRSSRSLWPQKTCIWPLEHEIWRWLYGISSDFDQLSLGGNIN